MSEIVLSDEEIERLIIMPKKIVNQPSKEDKREKQHFRNDMKLLSIDGLHSFTAYFRRHAIFIENFSIGLIYNPSALRGKITLFRCNGAHGQTRIWEHHVTPHIHRPTQEDLLENRDVESDIQPTIAYTTYQEAVVYFAKHCCIKDACDYINNFRQLSIF